MTPTETPNLTQILADLEYVKGRGCPHVLRRDHQQHIKYPADYNGNPWYSDSLQDAKNAIQATIMEIMGWWVVRTGEIHNIEPCWITEGKWRVRLDSDLRSETRYDTPSKKARQNTRT